MNKSNMRYLAAVAAVWSFALSGCGGNQPTESKNTSVQASQKVSDSFAAKLISGDEPAPSEPTPVQPEKTNEEVVSTQSDVTALPAPSQPVFGSSDKMHLVIYKSALDKEFLLSGSLIEQTVAATGSGLNSRVVAFKRQGDRVFMLESTQGHVVAKDLPSKLILAEIPIVWESDDRIELDFNKGMSKVFVASNWYASDIENLFRGAGYDSMANFVALGVSNSFIDSVKLQNNLVEIRQIVQVKFGSGYVLAPSFEVRYYLTPYVANPNYAVKETNSRTFDKVGYFEVPPTLEEGSGRTSIKVSKWDITKPVTFYVSANTPAEYVDAVKEGILYWNKAFGREVLKAEVAPAGVTAPDPAHNLVQWVNWDNAGFAYADALMDPRSGEIKNAQVYLTSAFAFLSKTRLRRFLRTYRPAPAAEKREANDHAGHRHEMDESSPFNAEKLLAVAGPKNREKKPLYKGASLEFLRPARLCNYELTQAAAAALEPLIEQNADDATLLRVSQDYVRLVTAHEIGHTLGLRHNFAGNLGSNVSIPQRDALFRDYVLKSEVPEAKHLFSSSVMEYMNFADDVLAAAQIKAGGDVLPYDKAAIAWGYMDQPMPEKSPLFCTDSHSWIYLDCDTFDSSSSLIANWAYESVTGVTQMPMNLVERYMAAKAPNDSRDAVPLDQVGLYPESAAFNAALRLFMALQPLSTRQLYIALERQHPVVDELNGTDALYTEQLESVKAQLKALGGLEWAYFTLLPANKPYMAGLTSVPGFSGRLADGLKKQLDSYLSRSDVKSFTGLDGKQHAFSDKEIAFIQSRAAQYFEKFEGYYYAWLGIAFGAVPANLEFQVLKDFPKDGITYGMKSALESTIRNIVNVKSGKSRSAQVTINGMKPTVSVPTYAYGVLERRAMASYLTSRILPLPNWSSDTRSSIRNMLTSEIESSLGLRLSEVTQNNVPSDFYWWLLDEQKVISSF